MPKTLGTHANQDQLRNRIRIKVNSNVQKASANRAKIQMRVWSPVSLASDFLPDPINLPYDARKCSFVMNGLGDVPLCKPSLELAESKPEQNKAHAVP